MAKAQVMMVQSWQEVAKTQALMVQSWQEVAKNPSPDGPVLTGDGENPNAESLAPR